jgi:hypothetical protein
MSGVGKGGWMVVGCAMSKPMHYRGFVRASALAGGPGAPAVLASVERSDVDLDVEKLLARADALLAERGEA